MKLEHLASANLGSSLLISAVPEQSPGLVASELLDLLRAMSRVPVSPGGCIVRQRLVSYFSQRLETHIRVVELRDGSSVSSSSPGTAFMRCTRVNLPDLAMLQPARSATSVG